MTRLSRTLPSALLIVVLVAITLCTPSPILAASAKDQALHDTCFYKDKDLNTITSALIVLPNFQDPKCQTFDVITLLLKDIAGQLIRFVLAIAFIFLVITGYQFVTSMGNKEGMESAKRSLLFITIGILVVLSAYMVVTFISNRFLEPNRGAPSTAPARTIPSNIPPSTP